MNQASTNAADKDVRETLHELGEYLNRIIFQAALLERKVGAEWQADVAVLREQSRHAAAALARLRQCLPSAGVGGLPASK